MTERIGFVGLGIMGKPMARNLAKAGYALVVHNRSADDVEALVAEGGAYEPAASPREVAERAKTVITMLPDSPEVREVVFGERGLLPAMGEGSLLVDMSTIAPATAVEVGEALAARGASALDAPVSGGDKGAIAGTLSIMVGGDAADVARAMPLFEAMGKTIVHQGAPGAGQHTKMVNQILISSNMVALCEGLLYGYKAGLDLETVFKSVSVGAAGSKALEVLGPRILARNFEPGFYVEHFIKDMGIALAEAEKMNLCLPGLGLAKQLYEAVRAQGYGRKGTHALMMALEHISGVKR